MSDQYASSDLTLYFSLSVMIEVCCIFMIMLLGNLLGYLLWNRHLDYLLLVMIYVGAKAKTPPFARGLR
jgi:hypothetical protein